MLKRLGTDQSLSAFAGRFVPLKLTTDGNPNWSKWARKYRAEGNGIPIVYVVRADGEKLYAKSGSLSGDALPRMLLATMRQSGRILSNAEAGLLDIHVKTARDAIAAKNPIAAARALGNLKKIGTLGQFGSYAKLALEADALVKQTRELGQTAITKAGTDVSDKAKSFVSVLQLVEGEKAYAAFPKLRSSNQKALGKVRSDTALAVQIEQARGVERARRYATSKTASIRKRAINAYQVVITKYPDTGASRLAKQELAAIDPQAATTTGAKPKTPVKPKSALRTWTDSTGQFKLRARLVRVSSDKVTLEKANGDKLELPLSRLSAIDQKYLTNLRKRD